MKLFGRWQLAWFYAWLSLSVLILSPQPGSSRTVLAAPQIVTGSVQAGCYLDRAGVCKIHVEPFTIVIAADADLETFLIRANDMTLYSFGTDLSNPPTGSITPSPVRMDFAAHCNKSYTVSVIAKDSSSALLVTLGTTRTFMCPEWEYMAYLPVLTRP